MIQKPCRDCGKPTLASRINADPVCDDCKVRRAVNNAPDGCDYCSEYPVAYMRHSPDPIYLCRVHAEQEPQAEVRYFRDFGTNTD